MNAAEPIQQISMWRKEGLFNVDFARYSLANHSFSRHFHSHYVIELVVNGTDAFYCNGRNFSAKERQFVFINPGEVHTGSTLSETPLLYYSLYPDKKTLDKIAGKLEISLPLDFSFSYTLRDDPHLAKSLEAIFESFQASCNNSSREEELFIVFMYELLSPANNGRPPRYSNEDIRVNTIIEFINCNYKQQLSLQNFSDLIHLNPFHLLRVFKRSTGLSPYGYLINTRIEVAKILLRNGWRIQDAAMQVGFYDTSHFYRLFKRATGISPKEYRSYKGQYRTIFTA
jgi:AraC-like DNA-binding protein